MGGLHPRTVLALERVDSTSDHAARLLGAGAVALPLLVRADRQTSGRGRAARPWWSDAGSLTFTLALDPEAHGLRAEHEPRVALAAAVATIEAIGPWLPPGAAGIRWPNDVEVAGRKLAGILPERLATPAGPRLLIGLGLNVRTSFDAAPPAVRRLATSLAAEAIDLPTVPEPAALLPPLLDRLASALAALAADDPALADRWAALDRLRGQPLRVLQGDRVISGIGRGIDAGGALLVEAEGGVRTIVGGSVLRD